MTTPTPESFASIVTASWGALSTASILPYALAGVLISVAGMLVKVLRKSAR